MRTFSRWMALAVLGCGSAAYADRNDVEVSKLGGATGVDAGANARFETFTRSLGAALTSANLMPPETLGHAGFSVNMELGVVALALPEDTPYPSITGQAPILPLLVPSIHVRKGLPFSVELGGRVGWIDRSSLFAATGEAKWAFNEGFTWLPDAGVRLHVTSLMGARDFSLTAAGVDLGVGKQFPLGGMVTLTPYGGVDFVNVSARSDLIDFRQNAAAAALLGRFAPVSAVNTRFYGGARFIGGVLQLGAELSLTTQGSIPSVFAFNSTIGLDF